MSNIAQADVFINYISEFKKIFVTRQNQPVTQKFKIDSNISDDYYFQLINKNNQIISLAGRSFKIYGSYIDARREIHILFFTDSYSIEDNVLHFHINTNTNEYNEYITTEYKEINVTIIETTGSNTQVCLRDVGLAYRRPSIEGDTPIEIVYRDILTGINVPLTGSFGVGQNINLFPGGSSYAFGEGLSTMNQNQTVFGQYNVPDAEQVLIVANGTDDNNRNNLFTVDFIGNAYLSGNRLLTNLDRTNISELNNDIGYITLADVPVYEAGDGLKKNGTTFSLTAVIPSAVSQLTNDTGFITVDALSSYALKSQIPTGTVQLENNAHFITPTSINASGIILERFPDSNYLGLVLDNPGWITGYNAGSGISIVNGTINCTVEGGGAEYTAGTGIGISDQNVISLTATIPTAVSQLSDASNYALTSQIPTNNNQLTNGAGYITNAALADYATTAWVDGKNYLTAVPDTYALKTDVPSAVSQLTNDSNFITSSALTGFAQTSAIPTSTSQLTNDSGFANYLYGTNGINCYDQGNGSWQIEGYGIYQWIWDNKYITYKNVFSTDDTISVDIVDYMDSSIGWQTYLNINYTNQQNTYKDSSVITGSQSVRYDNMKNVIHQTYEVSGGEITINPFYNVSKIDQVATFEFWVKPISGALTGINFGTGLTLVGDLPSSYTSAYTQVFTVRLVRNGASIQQFISYGYEFLENAVDYSNTPFTVISDGDTAVKIYPQGSPNSINLQYSKNGGAWTNYTIDDYIYLSNGETVAFSGANEHFSSNDGNNYKFVTSGAGLVTVYGNLSSLVTSMQSPDYGMFINFFKENQNLVNASNLIVLNENSGGIYNRMFFSCGNLLYGPDVLPATGLMGDDYYQMFMYCSSLRKSPKIMIDTDGLVGGGMSMMFYGCRNLKQITINFYAWNPSCTENWVDGVGLGGTFNCPSNIQQEYGNNYIPTGWKLVYNN